MNPAIALAAAATKITHKDVVDSNKGRIGKTANSIHGEEIKHSVYLGDGVIVTNAGNHISLTTVEKISGKMPIFRLNHEQVRVLIKAYPKL